LAHKYLGKKGILVGFRMGTIVDMSIDPEKLPFLDKILIR